MVHTTPDMNMYMYPNRRGTAIFPSGASYDVDISFVHIKVFLCHHHSRIFRIFPIFPCMNTLRNIRGIHISPKNFGTSSSSIIIIAIIIYIYRKKTEKDGLLVLVRLSSTFKKVFKKEESPPDAPSQDWLSDVTLRLSIYLV